MATRKRNSPTFLKHRKLVGIETLLIMSALKVVLDRRVKAMPEVPDWGKVLFVMLTTLGLFGVFVVIERIAAVGVTKTHEAVQAVPIPMPTVVIHLMALVGLFYLHAYVQNFRIWPM